MGLAGETARILEVFAGRLKMLDISEVVGVSHPLHDALGNNVGFAMIENSEVHA